MKHLKKLVTMILSIAILSSMCVAGSVMSVSASGTGTGLASWALNAYYSGWAYVYGGSSPGGVDCSGLIYSYAGGARTGDAQRDSGSEIGSVSAGIPRVHGLGLYQPGHVGVYVGNGMSVDARNESEGVCYSSVDYMGWTTWFKLGNLSYPTTGWEEFNGDYYYYEDGQYVVNTSRTIGGVTYNFGSGGASDQTPSDMSASAGGSSSGSSSTEASSGSSSETSSSSSATEPASVTLRLGSSGDAVTKLQNRLTELGFYTGEADGYFGEETEKAYKEFQKAAGVTVDGISGASDQEILYSDAAPYAEKTREPDISEDLLKAQERLKELNYYNGVCDGTTGQLTVEAITAFQLANDLDASGELNKETLALLLSDDAKENPAFVNETQATETAQEATSVYTFNAYQLNGTGLMGPEQPVENASVSSYVVSNPLAQGNADLAKNVAVQGNELSNKALSRFTSDQFFTEVGPNGAVKINAFSIALLLILAFICLTSMYMIIRIKKEHQRKAARQAMREEKRMSRLQSETRYW